jgi:hypothetical protein
MGMTAPNQSKPGNHSAGSFPDGRSPSACNPPNGPTDRRAGSFPLAGGASPIQRNDPSPMIGQTNPQPGPAVMPGKGAIAVEPGIAGPYPVGEMAKARG